MLNSRVTQTTIPTIKCCESVFGPSLCVENKPHLWYRYAGDSCFEWSHCQPDNFVKILDSCGGQLDDEVVLHVTAEYSAGSLRKKKKSKLAKTADGALWEPLAVFNTTNAIFPTKGWIFFCSCAKHMHLKSKYKFKIGKTKTG